MKNENIKCKMVHDSQHDTKIEICLYLLKIIFSINRLKFRESLIISIF